MMNVPIHLADIIIMRIFSETKIYGAAMTWGAGIYTPSRQNWQLMPAGTHTALKRFRDVRQLGLSGFRSSKLPDSMI